MAARSQPRFDTLEALKAAPRQSVGSSDPDALRYTPCYCEENVYRLCQRLGPNILPRALVMVVSNPNKTTAVFGQRSGSRDNDYLVIWDYHVLVLIFPDEDYETPSGAIVADQDSIMPWICDAELYEEFVFRSDQVTEQFRPWFRCLKACDFLAFLSSDRSHMLKDGEFMATPPPEPAIVRPGVPNNLFDLVDMHDRQDVPGRVLTSFDLDACRQVMQSNR